MPSNNRQRELQEILEDIRKHAAAPIAAKTGNLSYMWPYVSELDVAIAFKR